MKLTTFLLLVCFMHVSAFTRSQTITLSAKDQSIEKVLSVVRQQTGFPVLYNAPVLKKAKPVSVEAERMPLIHFLELIFRDQPLK